MELAEKQTSFAPAFQIVAETVADIAAREALLDRAMGPGRRRKSSEKLRRGRKPAEGLALAARDGAGRLVGTVRLWDVALGEGGSPALLLGPLAVEPARVGQGFGRRLVADGLAEAKARGIRIVVLVGDLPYYGRFGFTPVPPGRITFPGPVNPERILAVELADGALADYQGLVRAT